MVRPTADNAVRALPVGLSVAKSSGPPNGTLLIIGGGIRGTAIQEAAIQLGRGPTGAAQWIYVPTAEEEDKISQCRPPDFIARSGGRTTILHTQDRAIADSDAFVAPLRTASAVFF